MHGEDLGGLNHSGMLETKGIGSEDIGVNIAQDLRKGC